MGGELKVGLARSKAKECLGGHSEDQRHSRLRKSDPSCCVFFSGPLSPTNSSLLLPDPRTVLPEGSFFCLALDHALALRSRLCKTQFPHL